MLAVDLLRNKFCLSDPLFAGPVTGSMSSISRAYSRESQDSTPRASDLDRLQSGSAGLSPTSFPSVTPELPSILEVQPEQPADGTSGAVHSDTGVSIASPKGQNWDEQC